MVAMKCCSLWRSLPLRAAVTVIAATTASAATAGCASASSEPERTADDSMAPPVIAGVVERWAEATTHLAVDFAADGAPTVSVGAARASGLDAFWSIASTTRTSGTGFFYGDPFRTHKETRVARPDVARLQDLRDASALAYTTESVGPVDVGGIVVLEHAPTQRYLALIVDAIEPTDPRTAGAGPYAYARVRWYLSEPGRGDFRAAP